VLVVAHFAALLSKKRSLYILIKSSASHPVAGCQKMQPWQERTERGQGGHNAPGAESLGAPKSPNNDPSTFFNTVNLPLKDLRFEHVGTKLVSCSGRHLTSTPLNPKRCHNASEWYVFSSKQYRANNIVQNNIEQINNMMFSVQNSYFQFKIISCDWKRKIIVVYSLFWDLLQMSHNIVSANTQKDFEGATLACCFLRGIAVKLCSSLIRL